MSDPARLRRDLRALLADRSGDAGALDRLCAGAVSALPVDGAAISVTTETAVRDGGGASDQISARLDELQFSLGEGPCWEAVRHGRPVLVEDLDGPDGRRWPMVTPAALAAGFRAVFAFPLQIGAIRLGALGLLARRPEFLDVETLGDTLVIADVAALTLIDPPTGTAPHSSDTPPEQDVNGVGMRRAEVHQATGMLIVQLGLSAQDALARLRAHAYAAGRTLDEVARDVVARRLRLDGDRPA